MPRKPMIVYQITNLLDGMKYIGSTKNTLEHRWNQHKSNTSGCKLLAQAIKTDGPENFEKRVLEIVRGGEKKLYEREAALIKELRTMYPDGYNLTTGGKGGTLHPVIQAEINMRRKRINNEEVYSYG